MVYVEPVPMEPSLLDVHCMELLSEPSSLSVAEPENVTELPSVNEEPEDGDDIDTVGGEFAGSLTVIDMLSVSDSPPLSVTWAVMVWVPIERILLNDEPVPIEPSMLEVHWIKSLSEPSSPSVAVPWNVTEVPAVNSEPDDGDNIDTVGNDTASTPLIVVVVCSETDAPSESVTVAVMVCVPTESVVSEKKLSVVRNPSMLEVH